MKRLFTGLIFGLLLIFGAFIGSPYLAASNLQKAAMTGQAAELEGKIDFPRVRERLKSQLTRALIREFEKDPSLRDNPFSRFGVLLATAMVDKLVDAYVTAEGLAAILAGAKPSEGSSKVSNSNIAYDYRWVGMNSVVVDAQDPKLNKRGPSFVFERRGFTSWVLVSIELPEDFLTT